MLFRSLVHVGEPLTQPRESSAAAAAATWEVLPKHLGSEMFEQKVGKFGEVAEAAPRTAANNAGGNPLTGLPGLLFKPSHFQHGLHGSHGWRNLIRGYKPTRQDASSTSENRRLNRVNPPRLQPRPQRRVYSQRGAVILVRMAGNQQSPIFGR